MRASEEKILIDGPAGAIDLIVETPPAPRGIALVCHPHPLFGGANSNKVAHALARSFVALGYCTFRPNFRGVGQTAGTHDHGAGETEDLLAVLDWAHQAWQLDVYRPSVLAGFSFGAYVQTRVARRLADAGHPAKRLILVGTAAGFIEGARQYDTEDVPHDNPDFLVVNRLEGSARDHRRRWTAVAIMAATVIAAATGVMHISVAALAGVLAMVGSGCMPVRDMYAQVDWRVIFMIAALMPLSVAMDVA